MRENIDLVGLYCAKKRLDHILSTRSVDSQTELILLVGPPGSGRTTLTKHLLKENEYHVHEVSPEGTVAGEISSALSFCKTKGTVDTLLMQVFKKKRAVFIDDCLNDLKSMCNMFESIKKGGCKALVIASINSSTRATELRKKSTDIIRFEYPTRNECITYVLRSTDVRYEIVARCVDAGKRSIPKILSLIEGELGGTVAEEVIKPVDATIFEEASNAIQIVNSGRPFSDIEVAVSSEPALNAMLLRYAIRDPHPRVRRAFKNLSKTQQCTWVGSIMSTVAFAEAAKTHGREIFELKFPRYYTIASSRANNMKKMAQAEAEG